MDFRDSDKGKGVQENGQEINEIERSKIGIMRALIDREDPSAKEVDDLMIRRFLRARDLDIEKASSMLLKYLSWRRAFVPNGSISPSEIASQLTHKKLCMQGFDKKGRPIVVGFGGRHKPSDGTLDDFKRFVVYSLDKICARIPKGQEKFVCIGDLEGWGYSSSDVRGYLACLSILQDCFPERLGKLYIVHSPYIFMTVWKAVYPFIDNNTKKKEADDLTIRRFLRALDMDVEKGCTMLLNCLRWWRRAFVPNGFISESENPSQLAKNNLCLQGVDKKGRGALYSLALVVDISPLTEL